MSSKVLFVQTRGTPVRSVIKNEFNLAWMGVEAKRVNKWQSLGENDSTGLLRNLLE